MGATEGTHAGGEFLLHPMGDGLREHEVLMTAYTGIQCDIRKIGGVEI